MRREVRFLRRDRVVRLADAPPALTLLDYLRLRERATGTKEGCAEGDCGACTVVLRRAIGDRLVYLPVNACILLAGQADGAEVIAVEDLGVGDRLHPVQRAMVEHHGSQCGFCTPGFVMALFALYHCGERPRARADVNRWIAGNLCRCTGYRPIVDAALSACAEGPDDYFRSHESEARENLAALADEEDLMVGSDASFFAAPASIEALAALYGAHPDAVLVAGATDVGLWVTKELRDLRKIIWLGRASALDAIEEAPDAVTFGATVTQAAALPHLAAIDPDLGELIRRFAGVQVRSIATIGGNIANGSPIGDMPPALIALGTRLTLQRGGATRTVSLEDYFVDYGKQDRAPGEFVRAVRIPKLAAGEHFRCYKISKRFDQDISAVMAACKLVVTGSRISEARLAFGGMAEIPKRASETESALRGADLQNPATWEPALALLERDFSPLGDQRASACYRRDVARALLRKALLEIGGVSSRETRVFSVREEAHAGSS